MTELIGLADVSALSDLAQTVPDTGGVAFVPALAGLGAPFWDDAARGIISGLSHGSSPGHLARAAFEAIAHQVADVFEAMEHDLGHRLGGLSTDGGASRNDFLMQLQADLLGRPLNRSSIAEIGAFGVASMAALSLGTPFKTHSSTFESFESRGQEPDRLAARQAWHAAIERARFRPDR
jgi:glycerol kinase